MKLFKGDCLDVMQDIPDKSIDMILCDLPYGVTHCEWDITIPFDKLWEHYNRIIKDNGAILLFSQQPFTSKLVCSNLKMFRYEWIYEKTQKTGFLNARKMPLKKHENICVFYKKLPVYNPQFTKGKPYVRKSSIIGSKCYREAELTARVNNGVRYPVDILRFNNANNAKKKHPTEKPVDLCEYLIKTYTNEGDLVLDNCMGSGSTGVAAINTGRNFIGIEKDKNFFEIAKNRIETAQLMVGN